MKQETFFETGISLHYKRSARVGQTSETDEPLSFAVVVRCAIPDAGSCCAYNEFTLQADGSWQGRCSSGNDYTFWSLTADDIKDYLGTWGRSVRTFHVQDGLPKHLRSIWDLTQEEGK
jgi:hypothetical protein